MNDQAMAQSQNTSTVGLIGAAGINPQRARFEALSMALRTPGLNGHHDVLAAAKAYQAHIEGEAAPLAAEQLVHGNGTKFSGSGLGFGPALSAVKRGARIARANWNGKGMFVYLVPANSYPAQTGAAKAHFGEGAMVPYNAYLALKGADDTVSTWAPSGSDALAEDWLIVE